MYFPIKQIKLEISSRKENDNDFAESHACEIKQHTFKQAIKKKSQEKL